MFKIPEEYRRTDAEALQLGKPGERRGAFQIAVNPGRELVIIADDSGEWEHVSLRTHTFIAGKWHEQTPSWSDMSTAKAAFWDEEDCVIQYHPPREVYINRRSTVLHLWRPKGFVMPMPPKELV